MIYLVECKNHFYGGGNGYLSYKTLNIGDIEIDNCRLVKSGDEFNCYGNLRRVDLVDIDITFEGFALFEDRKAGDNVYKIFLIDMEYNDYNTVDDYGYFYDMTFRFLRESKIDTIIGNGTS